MKKKIMAILASAAVCLGLCGCGNNGGSSDNAANSANSDSASSSADSADSTAASGNSDWDYIANKGNLVVGITYNMPMNYKDENDELTGFETEFTKAVCEKLGVEPKFQLIEWTKKEIELKSKNIDLIWNGLTVSEDRKKEMLFTTSYMKNKHVTGVKSENAEKYPDTAAMANISIAFEGGSAGEDIVKGDEALKNCTPVSVEAQKDALLEVKSGRSDLNVPENIANTDEEYAIGARLEDTETVKKLNAVIDELAKDGTLKKIAEKYDLADALLIGGDSAASAVDSTAA